MQVNLSANLPNSTGEAAPTISKENADAGSVSAFLAQMGQVWNLDNGNSDAQIEETSGKQITGSAFNDSRSPLPDASNPLAKSAGMEPAPTLNPSGKQIAGSAFNDSENPLFGVTNPFARPARTEPVSTLNPSVLAQAIQGSGAEADALMANNAWIPNEDPNNPMVPKESAGVRNSQTDVPHPAQTTVETNSGIADEENAIYATGTDSIERYVENPSVESLSIFSTSASDRNLQAGVLRDSDSQTAFSRDSDFIVPQDPMPSQDLRLAQTIVLESRRGLSYQSELDSIPDDLRFADNSLMSRDSDAQIGSSQAAVSPGKPEGTVRAASETIRTDDAQGVQQAFQIESARQKILQAELENAPSNSSLNQAMHPEFREDLFSRSGSGQAPKDPASSGNLLGFRDANLQGGIPQVAISAKLENTVHAAMDKTSTGDSLNDQNEARNQSVSWAALQNKLESVAPDSSRLRTPVGERQQEMPVQFASTLARTAESSIPQASSPVQNVTSQPRELIQQIGERIQIQLRDGKSEIVVQLKPDSLGRLEIRAETTSNGVVARITTESGSVKGYLENNLHLLQQTLQDQGLKVDRIHIIIQDGFNSQSSSGYTAQFGHTGSGHYGSESHKSSETSGNAAANQPEEVVVDPTTWVSLNPNTRFHTVA